MIVILKVKKKKKKVKHLFGKSCMFLYNSINSFRRLEDLWIVDMDRPRLYRETEVISIKFIYILLFEMTTCSFRQ